jgi:hypothetical protein
MPATGTPPARAISKLLAATTVVLTCLAFTAGASASVRSCSYRNPTHGPVPYVAQVATNLTATAAGGAGVCEVVREAVAQVQLRGYDLDARPDFVEGGESWAVSHRLVYPAGWPRPRGPVYDPHMHVTLRMVAVPPAQSSEAHGTGEARARTTAYWIKLNEYT